MSHEVLDNIILQNACHQMWEKELVEKFKKPHSTQYCIDQSNAGVFMPQPDGRDDDQHVTPRGSDDLDREVPAVDTLTEEEQRRTNLVTKFPNQYKNSATNFFIREYEENEAPPPRLDACSYDKLPKHGQFLNKNFKPSEQEAKLMAQREQQKKLLEQQIQLQMKKWGSMKQAKSKNKLGSSNKSLTKHGSTTVEGLL